MERNEEFNSLYIFNYMFRTIINSCKYKADLLPNPRECGTEASDQIKLMNKAVKYIYFF